jgi:hypothetical protein
MKRDIIYIEIGEHEVPLQGIAVYNKTDEEWSVDIDTVENLIVEAFIEANKDSIEQEFIDKAKRAVQDEQEYRDHCADNKYTELRERD